MFEEQYNTLEEIPARVRHLYKLVNGIYVLMSAGEFKTQDDINRVQEALRKEREDHKAAKTKLSLFGEGDPEEIVAKLDRIAEYEEAAKGAIDETKLEAMVETRLKSRVAPIQRQLEVLKGEKETLANVVSEYKEKTTKQKIHEQIRKAAVASKMRESAIEDAILYGERVFTVEGDQVIAKEGAGVTQGIDPTVWLTEVQSTREHWWPESVGAGASGSRSGSGTSNNPFSAEHWNMTEQGALVRSNYARAEQMAKAAGTTIGGPKPKAKK